MFEVYTEEYIRNRLLNRISDSLSKMEGTILWEIMNSVTIESKEIYSEMENIYNQRIVSTATGDDLTAVCKDFFGINRKIATQSFGTVRFSGTNGTVISSGTIISTDNGLQYITTATGTVASGYIDIEAKSVNSGFDTNVAIGTVTKLVSTISGITTVSNITAMDSGTDIEEDEDLRERTYEKINTPITSENPNQYKIWAKEVSGIDDAYPLEAWNGPLSIKIFCIDSTKKPCSQGICDNAYTYVMSKKPVGATPTFVPGNKVDVTVVSRISLQNGYVLASVKAEIESRIATYLQSIAFKKLTISYAQISGIISNTPGVFEVQTLTVNGGTVPITINEGDVGVFNTLTLTV